jgi:hypothetical protein
VPRGVNALTCTPWKKHRCWCRCGSGRRRVSTHALLIPRQEPPGCIASGIRHTRCRRHRRCTPYARPNDTPLPRRWPERRSRNTRDHSSAARHSKSWSRRSGNCRESRKHRTASPRSPARRPGCCQGSDCRSSSSDTRAAARRDRQCRSGRNRNRRIRRCFRRPGRPCPTRPKLRSCPIGRPSPSSLKRRHGLPSRRHLRLPSREPPRPSLIPIHWCHKRR